MVGTVLLTIVFGQPPKTRENANGACVRCLLNWTRIQRRHSSILVGLPVWCESPGNLRLPLRSAEEEWADHQKESYLRSDADSVSAFMCFPSGVSHHAFSIMRFPCVRAEIAGFHA